MFIPIFYVGIASAQDWPDDDEWSPLACQDDLVMTDLYQDESGANDERDIVGELLAPAGLSSSDGEHLFLRLRLDADPAPDGQPRPFAWGVEVDLDDDDTTYELLAILDGNAAEIRLHTNTTTTIANSPEDPADETPIEVWPFDTNGRSALPDDTEYGGNPDGYLDLALPWLTLTKEGLSPLTPVRVWAASSSTPTSLNGDFACHDGGTGEPSLSDIGGDPNVFDHEGDSDGDGVPDSDEISEGTDPNDPSSFPTGDYGGGPILVGGGGCATGGGAHGTALTILAAVFVAVSRRAASGRRGRVGA